MMLLAWKTLWKTYMVIKLYLVSYYDANHMAVGAPSLTYYGSDWTDMYGLKI